MSFRENEKELKKDLSDLFDKYGVKDSFIILSEHGSTEGVLAIEGDYKELAHAIYQNIQEQHVQDILAHVAEHVENAIDKELDFKELIKK